MERVISYIDGFNLYFGLCDAHLIKCKWLNLQVLTQNLLKPTQQLVRTKYFTSRISNPPDKVKRQNTYLEALGTLKEFDIFYGQYQDHSRACKRCGYRQAIHNEKMTDVNISVEMLTDAFQDKFDTAILISADSDLTAPILAIKNLFPHKRVVVAFPPKRGSKQLTKITGATFNIGDDKIKKSVFPQYVQKADGYVLRCPTEWM